MTSALLAVSSDSVSPRLAWLLVDFSLKAAALLAVALLTNAFLRRSSAAVRVRVWTLAFVAALVLPLVSGIVPGIVPQWRIPIAGFMGDGTTFSIEPAGRRDMTKREAGASHDTFPSGAWERGNHRHDLREPGDLSEIEAGAAPDEIATGQNNGSRGPRDQHSRAGTAPGILTAREVLNLVLVAWLVGVAVLLVPFVTALVAKWRLLARHRAVTDPSAIQVLKQAALRLELSRQVRLVAGDEQTIPMTIGVLRPTIVVPSQWPAWPAERFRFVILHELAHVKRLDVLWQSIARVACAIYWFNPLAWYALSRMRFECEVACDDQVLGAGEPGSAYAGQLIEIARIYRPARFAGGIAMARSSKLEARVVSLLDAGRSHLPVGRQAGRLTLAFSLAQVLALSAVTAGNSPAAGVEPVKQSVVEQPVALAAQQADDAQNNPGRKDRLQKDDAQNDPVQKAVNDAPEKKPAAAAADPAAGQRDELQSQIVRLGALRGVNYAAVDKFFRGSRTGGICFVAESQDVQKELELSEEALAIVRSVAFDYRIRRTRAIEKLVFANRDLTVFSKNLSPDELKQKRTELLATFDADSKKLNDDIHLELIPKLKAALTDRQLERLQQIGLQAYGSHDLAADSELAQALELTPRQIEQIAAVNRQSLEREAGLVRGGDFVSRHLELGKERDAQAAELLTPAQREKYAALKGKPFNLALLSLQPAWQTAGPGQRPAISRNQRIMGLFSLAGRPDVARELGLSDEQAAKVGTIKDEFALAWKEAGGGFRPGARRLPDGTFQNLMEPELPPFGIRGGPDDSTKEIQKRTAEMVLTWHATTARFQPQLKQALTAEQYSRLRQIYWQSLGTGAYFDHDVIAALSITPEQQGKIAAIANEYRSDIQQLTVMQGIGGARTRGGEGNDAATKLAAKTQEQDAKINAVLTAEQLAAFATLTGKPFQPPLRMSQPPAVAFEPGLRGGLYSIVGNEAVQKDLGLTPDDVARLTAIKDKFNRAWVSAGGGFRVRTVGRANGSRVTFQEAAMPPRGNEGAPGQSEQEWNQAVQKKTEQWYATIRQFEPELKAALTPEQYKRLQQIAWQAMGTAAFSDPEVVALLAITPEQQTTITGITSAARSKRIALFAEGAGRGAAPPNATPPEGAPLDATRPDATELIAKMLSVALDQETTILAVLTKDQLDRFAQAKGPAFNVNQLLDDDQVPAEPNRAGAQAQPGPNDRGAQAGANPGTSNSGTGNSGTSNAGAGSSGPGNLGAGNPPAGRGMLSLMLMDQVLAELGIEKDSPQHAKVRELLDSFSARLNRRSNNPTEAERAQRATASDMYFAVEAELLLEMKEILKPEQFTRLRQLTWQRRGVRRAIDDPEIAVPLALTDEQKQKLVVTPADGDVHEILTASQREKLAALLGKPFDFPEPPTRPVGNRMPIATRPGGYIALATRPPILKELGIAEDAEQLAELRKLAVEHATELQKQLRENRVMNSEKVREIETGLRDKFDPQLKKLLTAEQFTRLRQIYWQQQRLGVLEEPEVIQALELTKEQQEQLAAANRAIFEKRTKLLNPAEGRLPGPVSDEIQAQVNDLQADLEKKSNEILTEAQRNKLAELKGKPFDLSLLRPAPGQRPRRRGLNE